MKCKRLVAGFALAGLAVALARAPRALAEDRKTSSKSSALAEACSEDLGKFCAGVSPGEGRLLKCALAHQKDEGFSQACRDALTFAKAGLKSAAKYFQESCGEDVQAFCGKEKPGQGRVLKCLARHQDDKKFSAECRELLDRMKKKLPSSK